MIFYKGLSVVRTQNPDAHPQVANSSKYTCAVDRIVCQESRGGEAMVKTHRGVLQLAVEMRNKEVKMLAVLR